MSVGIQGNSGTMDQTLTSLAQELSTIMVKLRKLNTEVNGQGSGVTFLEGLQYSPTDATTAQNLVNLFSNIQGVYYGTATVAAPFNFDNALSVLWGGQV